jgi:hypothetical protein
MKSTEAAYDQRLKDNERQRLRRLEIKSTEAGEQHLKERRRKVRSALSLLMHEVF